LYFSVLAHPVERKQAISAGLCKFAAALPIEQRYSSTSDREKIYNKHQDTIDMQINKRSLVCGLQNKL